MECNARPPCVSPPEVNQTPNSQYYIAFILESPRTAFNFRNDAGRKQHRAINPATKSGDERHEPSNDWLVLKEC